MFSGLSVSKMLMMAAQRRKVTCTLHVFQMEAAWTRPPSVTARRTGVVVTAVIITTARHAVCRFIPTIWWRYDELYMLQ